MPYLRILDIHFKYHLYGDDDPSTYDSLLKKFNSSFWIERQWFFTHRLGSRKGQIHGLLYPIGQYKQLISLLGKTVKDTDSYHQSTNLNLIRHVQIYNEEAMID
ncbi:unnamed protein product, partial [Rotaria sp. Silwood1]